MSGPVKKTGGNKDVAGPESVDAPAGPRTTRRDEADAPAPAANGVVPRMRPGSAGAQIAALLANLGEKERALIDQNRDGAVDEDEAVAAVNVADLDGNRTLDEKEIAALRDILGEAPATLDGALTLLAGKSGERAGKLLESLQAEQALAAKGFKAAEAALGKSPIPTASAAKLASERTELETRARDLGSSIAGGEAMLEDFRSQLGGKSAKAKLAELTAEYKPADLDATLGETAIFALKNRIESAEKDLVRLDKDLKKGLTTPGVVADKRAEIADLKARRVEVEADTPAYIAAKRLGSLETTLAGARKDLRSLEPSLARVESQLAYARAKERVEGLGTQISTVLAIRSQTDLRTDEALERLFSGAAAAPEAVARAFRALPPETVDRLAAGQLENADEGSDRQAVAAAVLREAGTPAGRKLADELYYGPQALEKRKVEVEAFIEQAESFRYASLAGGGVRTGFLVFEKPDIEATEKFDAILEEGIALARKRLDAGDPEGAMDALAGKNGAYKKLRPILRKEGESLSALGKNIDRAIQGVMFIQDLTVKAGGAVARRLGGPLAGAVAGGLFQALASWSRGERGADVLTNAIRASLEESDLLPPGGQAFVDGVAKGFTTLWNEIEERQKGGEEAEIDWANVITAAVAEGVVSYTTSKAAKALGGPDDPEAAKKGLEDLLNELEALGMNRDIPVAAALQDGLAVELVQGLGELTATDRIFAVFRWASRQLGLKAEPQLYELSDPPPTR